MTGVVSILLGLYLIAMFALGINHAGWTPWMSWFDLFAGLLALSVGGWALRKDAQRSARAGGPIVAGFITLVIWMVGISLGNTPIQSWINFAVGVCLIAVGLSAVAAPEASKPVSPPSELPPAPPPEWRRSA